MSIHTHDATFGFLERRIQSSPSRTRSWYSRSVSDEIVNRMWDRLTATIAPCGFASTGSRRSREPRASRCRGRRARPAPTEPRVCPGSCRSPDWPHMDRRPARTRSDYRIRSRSEGSRVLRRIADTSQGARCHRRMRRMRAAESSSTGGADCDPVGTRARCPHGSTSIARRAREGDPPGGRRKRTRRPRRLRLRTCRRHTPVPPVRNDARSRPVPDAHSMAKQLSGLSRPVVLTRPKRSTLLRLPP